MAEKPSDKWALPLCSRCHRKQHEIGEDLFWQAQLVNPWIVALTLHSISGDHEMALEVLDRI